MAASDKGVREKRRETMLYKWYRYKIENEAKAIYCDIVTYSILVGLGFVLEEVG